MRIIISDSCCLIDLRKADLLKAFLSLPYDIAMPNTLYDEELLRFTDQEKQILLDGGLKLLDLPGVQVGRAIELQTNCPALSIHDCLAFAAAENIPNSILLTGDGRLRSVANDHQIEVHGVLWAIDEMQKSATTTTDKLIKALELFDSDPEIFRLPNRDVKAFIRRYKSV